MPSGTVSVFRRILLIAIINAMVAIKSPTKTFWRRFGSIDCSGWVTLPSELQLEDDLLVEPSTETGEAALVAIYLCEVLLIPRA